MDVERFLAGNVALGAVLVVALAALGRANRSFLRDVGRDGDAPWRLLARLALGLGSALVLWVSILDNWRQLVSLPYLHSRRFPSERIELDPTPEGVRRVTFALIALSLVATACLVARHVGGYGIQLALLVSAVVLWAPAFVVRQRLDFTLALGGANGSSAVGWLSYAVFLLLTWAFDVAVILLCYAAALAAVALPVTLLLDVTRLRCPRTTEEAQAFFAALGDRTGTTRRDR